MHSILSRITDIQRQLQGDDNTFRNFPKHLQALVSHAVPNVDVVTLIYPKFETAGDLNKTVERFREWLQDRVIDIEVAHNTPSPTVDPSVHTILVGHSMGGIVAAEAYLSLASEQPIPTTSSAMNPEKPNFPSNTTLISTTGSSHPNPPQDPLPDTSAVLMFPHIQAVLAFDTPFLGLAPSMFASQVEGAHGMASTAYNTYNEASKLFGWGGGQSAAAPSGMKALPAPATSALEDAAAAPKWQSWGKVAMFAGAAGAVAAGGAAALYSQRERISAGWNWASGHLLFIGDLARAENLRRRVEMLEKATTERNAKCMNLYTNLGKGKKEGTVTGSGRRTFVNLPNKVTNTKIATKSTSKDQSSSSSANTGMAWHESINDKAPDEINAHCSMFTPRENPGFYALGEKAKTCIVDSIDQSWYQSSEEAKKNSKFPVEDEDLDLEGSAALGDGEAWERTASGEPRLEPEVLVDHHAGGGKRGLDGGNDDDEDGEGDVRMTESHEGKNQKKRKSANGQDFLLDKNDEQQHGEELEDSVIVEKASRRRSDRIASLGEMKMPLPDENPWT